MKNDIIGQKYNKLTVLDITSDYKNKERLYICQCDCNKTVLVTKYNLIHNRVKSCGCLVKHHPANRRTRKIDIKNKVFGKLLVLQEDFHALVGGVHWLCQCECGKKVVISGIDLRRGSTKSCGCLCTENLIKLNKKKRLSDPWKVDIASYQKSAKNRNIVFELTDKEFKELISSKCYYCNRTPEIVCSGAELREMKIYRNGIDRLDSNIGYVKNNCVTCCKYCNFEKRNQSFDQFILNTKLRYEYLKSIGKI